MIDFTYLCEYFEEYKDSSSQKEKDEIEKLFIKLIFEEEGFTLTRNNNVIYGDLYEDEYNITHEQKLLFLKWCVHKMFLNFLDEEEYKNVSIERGYKRALEISDKDLWDTPTFDLRIEDYFDRTVYYKLKRHGWKFHDKRYFQCRECGGLFKKNDSIRNTRQIYCKNCKIDVEKRKKRNYKTKVDRSKSK